MNDPTNAFPFVVEVLIKRLDTTCFSGVEFQFQPTRDATSL